MSRCLKLRSNRPDQRRDPRSLHVESRKPHGRLPPIASGSRGRYTGFDISGRAMQLMSSVGFGYRSDDAEGLRPGPLPPDNRDF
jgi:hypothetical protein